jgi:hypothetical protein
MSIHRVELPAWECADLLRSRSVGRICVIDHGYPVAIPVNYEVTDTDGALQVVVRTAPETILGRYEGLGSIEVDDIPLDDGTLGEGTTWSVIGRGTVHRVSEANDLPDPHPIIDTSRERWITLRLSVTTGRRFTIRRDEATGNLDWKPTQ